MKHIVAFLIFLFSGISSPNIWAAPPTYPSLTGRVVDQAGILTTAQKDQLAIILQQHEQKTSNQVVVAVVKSLEGHDIAEYAVGLFRYWQLGQKDKNNGVLLLIATNDREIDIEVGYGLEGTLTDAISNDIIQEKIIPLFKEGNYGAGILEGVNSVLLALDGGYVAEGDLSNSTSEELDMSTTEFFEMFIGFLGIFFLFVLISIIAAIWSKKTGKGRSARSDNSGVSNYSSRSSSSSSSDSDSGFSGGGGSSGGGGARGSW